MTTAIRLYRTYILSTFVPLNTIRTQQGDVKKAQTAKKAEKYKKSNGLKDKQNDSK